MYMIRAFCVMLFSLLVIGCASDVRVFVDDDTPEAREALKEAEYLLGVPLTVTDDPYGAVRVEWRDEPWVSDITHNLVAGEAYPNTSVCRRSIAAIREGSVVAHELAHALGVEHVETPGDLMFENYQGFHAIEGFSQVDDFVETAQDLNRRCP